MSYFGVCIIIIMLIRFHWRYVVLFFTSILSELSFVRHFFMIHNLWNNIRPNEDDVMIQRVKVINDKLG